MIRKTLLFVLYFFFFLIVSTITLLSWHIFYSEESKEYARQKWEQQKRLEEKYPPPKKSGNPEIKTVFIFNQLEMSYATVFDEDTKVLRFNNTYYIPIIPFDANELIEWSHTNVFSIKQLTVKNLIQLNGFFQTTDNRFIESICDNKYEALHPLYYKKSDNIDTEIHFEGCLEDVSSKPRKTKTKGNI